MIGCCFVNQRQWAHFCSCFFGPEMAWSEKLSVEYLRENLTFHPTDIINGLASVSNNTVIWKIS